MSSPRKATPLQARTFVLRTLGLTQPFVDIGAALAHLGYVQIDPINVCGRMHDLILRNRVPGYREGDLTRHLHGNGVPLPADERRAFEHHHPDTDILAAFPLDAWPHLQTSMHGRSRRTSAWSGRLTPTERKLAPVLIEELRARGPSSAEDFDDARRAHRVVWGRSSLVKSTLQKLFFHGELLIAGRINNRRLYHLPEAVLPASTLAKPPASAAETDRWKALLKLRQRRLALLKRDELRLVADEVQAVAVEGCPVLHCLREDLPLWDELSLEPAPSVTRLLAPLDPLIYDRRVTTALWGFDYTWEVYTPPAKRVRGYYALPVLSGTELVGHVDAKANREAGTLAVMSRSVRRGHRSASAVADLARWLGLRG